MNDGELIPIDNIQSKEDQAYRAYKKRLSGESWSDIANSLRYPNPTKAKREVDNLIAKAAHVATDEMRREVVVLELDRLDALQSAVWGMAIGGDLKAVDSVLKIMGHRARLLQLGEEAHGNTVNTIIVSSDDYAESLKEISK